MSKKNSPASPTPSAMFLFSYASFCIQSNTLIQDHILGISVSANSLVHHYSVCRGLPFVAIHVVHAVIPIMGSVKL